MVDDLIADGDLVVINSEQEDPYDGAIVVATHLNGEGGPGEATLKRFYHESGEIRLQPANPKYEPIHIEAAEWKRREWKRQGELYGLDDPVLIRCLVWRRYVSKCHVLC